MLITDKIKNIKRVMIKLSGEALGDSMHHIFNKERVSQICSNIAEVYRMGLDVSVVVGGGNICRGTTISQIGIERTRADQMGMLATVINSIALQSQFESMNIECRICSAVAMPSFCEQYIISKGRRHLEKNRLLILSAGTGNPFFTTDTGAVLRAIELRCDLMLKGTNSDGIYPEDPKKNSKAEKYSCISYDHAIVNNLAFMDATAITIAKEQKLPIALFNISKNGLLKEIIDGSEKSINAFSLMI